MARWRANALRVPPRAAVGGAGEGERAAPPSAAPRLAGMSRAGTTGAEGSPAPPLPPISAELFTLTYGALVRQLLDDLGDAGEVNAALERMGRSMGLRAVDEFLAKTAAPRCTTFKQAAEAVAGPAFKMFLGVRATVCGWNSDATQCSLVLEDNPLADLVELPEDCAGLSYCEALCGAVAGALEAVNVHVRCEWARDALRGDDAFEMRLTLVRIGEEEFPYRDGMHARACSRVRVSQRVRVSHFHICAPALADGLSLLANRRAD